MDNNINYNEKSQACIKQFRRAFLLTSAFVLFAMAFMYGSTEDTYLSRTMSLTRLGNWTIFNITQESLEKLSKSLTYQSVNKLRYLESSADPQTLNTAQASLSGSNRTTLSRAGQTSSLEYPGMLDPCSKPRRFTGVEDILCMVGTTRTEHNVEANLQVVSTLCGKSDNQYYCSRHDAFINKKILIFFLISPRKHM